MGPAMAFCSPQQMSKAGSARPAVAQQSSAFSASATVSQSLISRNEQLLREISSWACGTEPLLNSSCLEHLGKCPRPGWVGLEQPGMVKGASVHLLNK